MITSILFDFGDVFLDLDKSKPERLFRQHPHRSKREALNEINKAYECGEYTTKAFLKHYQNAFPSLSLSEIQSIWNAMLVRFPEHRLDFIQKLAKEAEFKLLLLSNTNASHIDWVQRNIAVYDRFKSCFHGFYLSHELGLRKPDFAVYRNVLAQHDLQPAEVLFIDDKPENTRAARELGMQTWTINPSTEDITELFQQKSDLF